MSAVTLEQRPAAKRRRGKVAGWGVARIVYLVLLGIFTVLPMAWMLLTSVKTQFAALQYPPEWIPSEPTLEQYTRLLSPANEVGQEFLHYLLNSIMSGRSSRASGCPRAATCGATTR